MSVLEIDKIDGIGIHSNEDELVILITDHVDWRSEYNHLLQLQNKINAYISFIENKQYLKIYQNRNFNKFCIEIHFKYNVSENCRKFIETTNNQLEELKIHVDIK